MVQLSDDLVRELDELAAARGASRSSVIRQAIDEHLHAAREHDAGRRIVAGYRAVPPAVPDEWGDLAAAADRATAELGQRLDAEERAAGIEPW
jgi:Arc/MetJ-type ribon-helix-helix transcriptional regulator